MNDEEIKNDEPSMGDLKFTTAGDYMKDFEEAADESHVYPGSCPQE